MNKGDLKPNEPHPAAVMALEWLRNQPFLDLLQLQESFASSALAGNRMAEICGETLRRFIANEPVSDRYILGLAWVLATAEKEEA